MITVWKFDLPVADGDYEIKMPIGADILKIADQYGDVSKLVVWAKVDPHAGKELRRFRTIGTGHRLDRGDDEKLSHIDSVITFGGQLVWHVFEVFA